MMIAIAIALGANLPTGGEAGPTPPSDPVNLDAPILTSNGIDTLSCTDGVWGGTTPQTPSYSWEREIMPGMGWFPVLGEVASTLTYTSGDGEYRCTVTMVNETAVPVSAVSNTFAV